MEETVYFSGNQLPHALHAIAPAILCTVPLSISDSEMNSNTRAFIDLRNIIIIPLPYKGLWGIPRDYSGSQHAYISMSLFT